MLITSSNTVTAESLKGSVLVNPNGAEFYVLGVELNLAEHKVVVVVKDCEQESVCGLYWDDLKDWKITVQAPYWE
jgi:hypothetical protein